MSISKEEVVARVLADLDATNRRAGRQALDSSKRLLRLCMELTMEAAGDSILSMPEEAAIHIAGRIAASHALLWADRRILTPAGTNLIRALAEAGHKMPEDLVDRYYKTVQMAVEQLPDIIAREVSTELKEEGEEA